MEEPIENAENVVSTETMIEPEKPKRGFAALTKTQISEIARRGGRSAHARGTAYKFTHETARVAGAKGGRARGARRKEVSS